MSGVSEGYRTCLDVINSAGAGTTNYRLTGGAETAAAAVVVVVVSP